MSCLSRARENLALPHAVFLVKAEMPPLVLVTLMRWVLGLGLMKFVVSF